MNCQNEHVRDVALTRPLAWSYWRENKKATEWAGEIVASWTRVTEGAFNKTVAE